MIRAENKGFWRAATIAASCVFGVILTWAVTGCSGASPTKADSRDSAATTDPAAAAAPMAAGIPATAPSSAEKGKQFFQQSCSNCHGMNGQGVPHLGADLRTNKVVAQSTDAQLVSLIEHGIPANDPRNTAHIPMPPKGANPSLTAEDLHDIVSYLRQLQKENAKAK
jgi:mono/diheme cytochrome c family protein